jgi:hypothetical protein
LKLSVNAQEVLHGIFAIGPDQNSGIKNRRRVPTPGAKELFEFCEILATEPPEEILQSFLEHNPGFLTGITGTIDNTDLAVLYKPRIGSRYIADFCVLQSFQGGSVANLIEIETSHEPIYTKNGKPARRLSDALKQVEDWRLWIDQNQVHFAKELINSAKALSPFGDHVPNGRGFRTKDAAELEWNWKSFGGFDQPYFSYTILAGRWSKLENENKARIIARNRQGERDVSIYTYEQLARVSNYRLDREEF